MPPLAFGRLREPQQAAGPSPSMDLPNFLPDVCAAWVWQVLAGQPPSADRAAQILGGVMATVSRLTGSPGAWAAFARARCCRR